MNDFARHPADSPAFPAGGEVSALMRDHDWSASPLGAPSAWPQSLRSVVGLLPSSKFPMFVAWGPELEFLYNVSVVRWFEPDGLAQDRRVWSIWG